MQPLLVIVAGIVCNGVTRLTEAIVVATPDLFFLDGADHALNVGVVIRSIVSSVLSLDTVFEELQRSVSNWAERQCRSVEPGLNTIP